ncbi:Uncharacterised protein [uncultured Eubacterium sp.]|nr:Uncharacterised protein [uncultured Eubacterium sp.]
MILIGVCQYRRANTFEINRIFILRANREPESKNEGALVYNNQIIRQ